MSAEPGRAQPPPLCRGSPASQPGTAHPHDRCMGHGEGVDSPPPGTCFPFAIKHTLSLIKPSNQCTSYRRKGNSWANLAGLAGKCCQTLCLNCACYWIPFPSRSAARVVPSSAAFIWTVAAGSIRTSQRSDGEGTGQTLPCLSQGLWAELWGCPLGRGLPGRGAAQPSPARVSCLGNRPR